MTDDTTLETLTRALITALKRDATLLESDGAPDLARLADHLEQLLELIAGRSDARRHLVDVLDAVDTFHRRVKTARDEAATALEGAAQRRLASRAYVQAERYGGGGRS